MDALGAGRRIDIDVEYFQNNQNIDHTTTPKVFGHISVLPIEMLSLICSHLELSDVAQVLLISKIFKIAIEDGFVLKQLIRRSYPMLCEVLPKIHPCDLLKRRFRLIKKIQSVKETDVQFLKGLFHPLAGQQGVQQPVTTLFTSFANVGLEQYVSEFNPRPLSWWVLYSLSDSLVCYFEGPSNSLAYEKLFLFNTKTKEKLQITLPCPMLLFKFDGDSLIVTDGKTAQVCLLENLSIKEEKLIYLKEHSFSCDPGSSFIKNGFLYYAKENWKGTVRINLIHENSEPEILHQTLWPPFKILSNSHFYLSSDGTTTKLISKRQQVEEEIYFEEAINFSNCIEVAYGLLFLGSNDTITVIELAKKKVLATIKLPQPMLSNFPDNIQVPLQLSSSAESSMDGLYFFPILKFENDRLRFFMKDPSSNEISMGILNFSEDKF